jgi:hypothetical protein
LIGLNWQQPTPKRPFLLHRSAPDPRACHRINLLPLNICDRGRMGVRSDRLLAKGSGPDRHPPSPRCAGGRGRICPSRHPSRSRVQCSIPPAAFSGPNSGRICDCMMSFRRPVCLTYIRRARERSASNPTCLRTATAGLHDARQPAGSIFVVGPRWPRRIS